MPAPREEKQQFPYVPEEDADGTIRSTDLKAIRPSRCLASSSGSVVPMQRERALRTPACARKNVDRIAAPRQRERRAARRTWTLRKFA